jgi:copper chaperone CopZ
VEEPAVEEPAEDDSASLEPATVRFVADKSVSVPGMQCPYSCYPAIEKALASVPGVEAVQLAEQPAGTPEGTIETKVVELKLGDGFDIESALAALKEASFEGEVLN